MKTELLKSTISTKIIFKFYLLIITLLTYNASAQKYQWAEAVETKMLNAPVIATHGNNSIYIAADFDSFAKFSNMSLVGDSLSDIGIAKYDSNGNVVWLRAITGKVNDDVGDIASDLMGNVLVAGTYISDTLFFDKDYLLNNDTYQLPATSMDGFLAKYDSTGNYLWSVNIVADSANVYVNRVTTDQDNNIYVSGYFRGDTLNMGNVKLPKGKSDRLDYYFVLKYDANGNLLWSKAIDFTIVDIGTDLNGYLYLAGNTSLNTVTIDTVTLTRRNGTSSMNILLQLHENGDCIWGRAISSSGSNTICMTISNLGEVYIGGRFNGTTMEIDTFVLNGIGSNDIFLAKFNTSSNCDWAKLIGGSGADNLRGLDINYLGDLHVLMTSGSLSVKIDSNSFFYLMNGGSSGAPIYIKLNSSGKLLGGKDFYLQTNGSGALGGFFISSIHSAINGTYITGRYKYETYFGEHYLQESSLSGMITPYFNGFVLKIIPCDANSINKSNVKISSCGGFVSPRGNNIWSSTGTYYDTIMGVNGCDSIIIYELTIKEPSHTDIYIDVCDFYELDGWKWYSWNWSGSHDVKFTNSAGCDSIVTMYVTIHDRKDTAISVTSCKPYTSPSGTYIWNTSGSYRDTLLSSVGCDSVILIQLTMDQLASEITDSSCGSYRSPSGKFTWTSSGTYYDTLTNAEGCDSLLTVHLTLREIDTSVTLNGNMLLSNVSGATYQWINCKDNTPVPGATRQNFIPEQDGSYALVITYNDCTDTSSCYTIEGLSVLPNSLDTHLKIYPNPASNQLNIEVSGILGLKKVRLMNSLGQEIIMDEFRDQHLRLNVDGIADGIYMMLIQTDMGNTSKKIILKR